MGESGDLGQADVDALEVESLPLRWLALDATDAGTAALAYRHYTPSAAPAPASQMTSCESQPGALSLSSSAATAMVVGAAVAPAPAAPPQPGGAAGSAQTDVCVLYCNGLKSHMNGAKVRRALNVAAAAGCEFVCFDYSGFGGSRGRVFESCGLQDWVDDAAALLARVVTARLVVIVGSSIGGCVALRLAQLAAPPAAAATATAAASTATGATTAAEGASPASLRTERAPRPATATIAGLLLIAPAVDLSEVRWAALTEAQQRAILYDSALVMLGSPYRLDGGDAVGLSYFVQGRRNLLHIPAARTEALAPGRAYPGPLAAVLAPRVVAAAAGAGASAAAAAAAAAAENETAASRCAPAPPMMAAAGKPGPASAGGLTAMEASAEAGALEPGAEPGGLQAEARSPAGPIYPTGGEPRQPGGPGVPERGACGISVGGVPVVILHGSDDDVVPLQHAEALLLAINAAAEAEAAAATPNPAATGTVTTPVAGAGVPGRSAPAAGSATAPAATTASLHVLAGGDHRLSSVEALRALQRALVRLVRGARHGSEL